MEWVCSLAALGLVVLLVVGAAGSKKKQPSKGASRARQGTRASRSGAARARDSVANSGVSITIDYGGGTIRGEPATSAECWVPPGRTTKVGPHRLEGGMLYVGQNLPDLRGWNSLEPALIDPELERQDRRPDHAGNGMSYWPSYATIPAACRSGYLAWLADGRSAPGAYVGYVFLFLYGLERRALHDAESLPEAAAERPAIAAEVARLLEVYGANNSFRGYASGFLEILRAGTLAEFDLSVPPPPASGRELPFHLRCGVARMALDGRPLPPDWALSWVRSDPEIRLRTPARRCPEEFDALFRRTYEARHGAGLTVKPCKRTISLNYRPSSASFGQIVQVPTDLPDVTSLVGPRRKLTQLASECEDELASFSRWIRKFPEGRDQLAAAAVLPQALMADHAPRAFRELKGRIEARLDGRDLITLPAEDVVEAWLPPSGEKQTKKNAVEAARLLAQAGLGIEPDARFGGRRVGRGDPVVVFRLGADEHETPTPGYTAATLLLHLATVVSAADGEVSTEEEESLSQHLAAGLHLDASERRRLAAHLHSLLAQTPSLAGVKRRLEGLSPTQREGAGRFLVRVAWADGVVEPAEVKCLTKIFRLLELDPGKVHQWLHDAQTGTAAPAPVPVRPGAPTPGYAIPQPDAQREPQTATPAPAESVPAALDMEAIQAKLDETAAVSALLSGIFSDEDEEQVGHSVYVTEESDIAGLDAAHSTLLRRLGEKSEWNWEEYEELAESLGLMPSGALDQINDAAFEVCDLPLTDGEDPIAIDAEVFREVVA